MAEPPKRSSGNQNWTGEQEVPVRKTREQGRMLGGRSSGCRVKRAPQRAARTNTLRPAKPRGDH